MKEVGDCDHLLVFQTLKCDEMLCKDLKRYFLTSLLFKKGGGGYVFHCIIQGSSLKQNLALPLPDF